MKYLKKFKIFETGEWSSDIDWDYVKDNPDDDSEEASSMREMENKMRYIENAVNSEGDITFKLIDISAFDLYQGPYATIKINKDKYNIWNNEYKLWVENFPIDNTSELGLNPGFDGDEDDIIEAIIEYYKPINKELRKYNI